MRTSLGVHAHQGSSQKSCACMSWHTCNVGSALSTHSARTSILLHWAPKHRWVCTRALYAAWMRVQRHTVLCELAQICRIVRARAGMPHCNSVCNHSLSRECMDMSPWASARACHFAQSVMQICAWGPILTHPKCLNSLPKVHRNCVACLGYVPGTPVCCEGHTTIPYLTQWRVQQEIPSWALSQIWAQKGQVTRWASKNLKNGV